MDNKIDDSRIDLDIRVNRVVPDNSKFKFTPVSFKIFMMIKYEQRLNEVYKMSNLDRKSFDQAINSLYRQGLLQKEEIKAKYIGQDDIEKIKTNLITQIGPWGHFVFNDTLEVLGLSMERVPKLKMPLFINSIIEQIPSNKVIKFKESVKDLVDSYA